MAVIDSGVRPSFNHMAPGTLIGCENFSRKPDFDPAGNPIGIGECLSDNNWGHGTFVAGAIAGNGIFSFDSGSILLQSVAIHAPEAIINPGSTLAMLGSAPNVKIYSLSVFNNVPFPADSSEILDAVNRVIELKKVEGYDIGVVNMSLGRRTLFAGQGIFEEMVDALLEAGIVPVIGGGNSGNSPLTTASPASALATLGVAAGSLAHQERIAADVFFTAFGLPVGIGSFVRPSELTQTASFSSRGPDADGSGGPDVIATGLGVFGQGLSVAPDPNLVNLGNGTSFSTALVSGVAALLRQAFPGATATQIRNAIILAASSEVTTDGSTELDEGQGWVNAHAAYRLLDENGVSHLLDRPFRPRRSVRRNVERGTDLEVSRGSAQLRAKNLKPGGRSDILLEIPENTRDVRITLSDVDAAFLPSEFFGDYGPGKQNCFFVGDAIMLNIHSAKTSFISTAISAGDYFDLNPDPTSVSAFIVEDQEVTIIIADRDSEAVYPPTALVIRDDLEPGIVRVTVAGDVVNAGPISAKVAVTTSRFERPSPTLEGTIHAFEWIQLPDPLPGPPDVDQLQFRLNWNHNWGKYPTNDLDMQVYFFDGTNFFPIFVDGGAPHSLDRKSASLSCIPTASN